MGINSTTDDSCAKYCSISHSFSLWMRLYIDRKHIIFKLVTYTMNSDAKKKKKRQPPLKLHRFAACGEVWNVKKKMCIPGSLSLSLSLSPPLEKRARGEVGRSWPMVRTNHPGCHLQPPSLPYWVAFHHMIRPVPYVCQPVTSPMCALNTTHRL